MTAKMNTNKINLTSMMMMIRVKMVKSLASAQQKLASRRLGCPLFELPLLKLHVSFAR